MIVTPDGGPATIVRDGETGRIATDERFADAIAEMLRAGPKGMGKADALTYSWDAVFERVKRQSTPCS